MQRLPGLFQRGGVWWLRVMVPMDLRLSLDGRTKVVRSLNTRDRRQASRLALLQRAALLSAFEHGQLDSVRHHWRCDPRPPAVPAASRAAAAQVTSHEADLPEGFVRPASSTTVHVHRTLRDVYDKWAAMSEGGIDAKRSCARALSLYERWAGPTCPPIQEITRAQGHEFKAWLLDKSRAGEYASKTVHGYLVNVCGLLRFAHQELEWTPRHCWRGIAIEYQTETPRARWSARHFDAMAGLPLFRSMDAPKGWQSGGLAAYWMPLMSLYSGATVSELAQIKLADVVDERGDGLWLRITDTGEGQGLKTTQRRRTIPVHSELIRLGLGSYIEDLRKSGADSLWPKLRLHPTKPGIHFSNWWGRFRRAEDSTEILPDFHSMRHTARSTMADSGLDAAVLDVITGHGKKGSEGVRTYTHFSRATLRAVVEAIRYPALAALQRIYSDLT